jgi:hypothetical protein
MEAGLLAELLDQPLIGRDELAGRLHVSAETIALWTAQKRIPAFRLGYRTLRYNYPAVLVALSKYLQPQGAGWSRKLPKRKPVFLVERRMVQLELDLEDGQMGLFTSEEKDFRVGKQEKP